MKGALEEKKPHKMVRSSIACARCRRSKVKCVNNGPNSTCKSCAQSNRECTYPVAGSTPNAKRPEASTGAKNVGEITDSKKRNRKVEESGRRVSQRVREDLLDSPILTRKVWDEIFELFKLHFSTEMPFLHPPTFRNRMRQAAVPRDPATLPADLEEGRVLLLGVLTLTARYHPGLASHHSPNAVNPLAASEFYAGPLASALGPTIRHLSRPSIENIQALLMLGLYEWSQTRGLSAWLYVGMAIRLAFSMGLAYIDDSGNQPLVDSRTPLPSTYPRDGAMEKEVRRRTLWSCFIMDRMLSAGRNRPTMISIDNLAVQLPCSDDQFLFVSNGPTSFLSPKWMIPNEQYISSQDEGVLSWYLRLVVIFGDLSEWVHAGGRKTETLPPWAETTGFYALRQRLKEFYDGLPPSLNFTEANLSAHIEKRNATTYASLHTLYCICVIVLNREYIPFVPLRCEKPMGPLDFPMYLTEKYEIPDGFWEVSAKEIMKATRDIIEIVRTCQDSNALPESPQIGYAIWHAAFVCVYILWFPKMDTEGYLVDQSCPETTRVMKSKGLLILTQKLLGDLAPTLNMMKGYVKCIDKIHRFYFAVCRDYSIKFKRSDGLEIFKYYERDSKELGLLRENDHAFSETMDEPNCSIAISTDNGPPNLSRESMQGTESASQRQNGSWAPINAMSSSADEDRSKFSLRGQYPYGISYLHQQAPSIPLTSNGDTNLNPTVTNSISYGSQVQNHTIYSSIAPQNIAPPNVTHLNTTNDNYDQIFYKWIESLGSIGMNTGLDNFAQEVPMEQFTRNSSSQCGHQQMNFLQATWSAVGPITFEAEIRGA
ncbi:putative transcriptional regulatory protein PB1A11.04c [Golovinomyces cichoracearum]|uniref:Putative transcriptional regulatory protein PB1A11.04c n=1 Tax=Golovinomyces cichoracearum TaxID=62708 RepID=A0A420IRK9_9PEZI|nr:putative transcriptional regulatory protein PB1A11.04c [Golovinomyces cichoracearum]